MIKEKISIEETNINLTTDLENHGIYYHILKLRQELKLYIMRNEDFLLSLEPVIVEDAPLIVRMMARASGRADVGPMAAVAGSIAQLSMLYLTGKGAKTAIVDNGGDISIKSHKDVVVGLYAVNSSLSGNIGFKLKHEKTPTGVCTSSGMVGHSISFGRADSVTVFADESSTADALATSIANEVKGKLDSDAVGNGLAKADDYSHYFRGALVIVGESAGFIGKIPQIIKTEKKIVLGDLFDIE